MTTATLTIPERVAAGAAFLNEHRPGWLDRTDLDLLNVTSLRNCPLGQQGCCYACVTSELGLTDRQTVDLGFTCTGDTDDDEPLAEAEYESLTAEWKRVITERRSAA